MTDVSSILLIILDQIKVANPHLNGKIAAGSEEPPRLNIYGDTEELATGFDFLNLQYVLKLRNNELTISKYRFGGASYITAQSQDLGRYDIADPAFDPLMVAQRIREHEYNR